MSVLSVGRRAGAATAGSIGGAYSYSASMLLAGLDRRAQVRLPPQACQQMIVQRQWRSTTASSCAAKSGAERPTRRRRQRDAGSDGEHVSATRTEDGVPSNGIARQSPAPLPPNRAVNSGRASLEQVLKTELLQLCDLTILQSRRASDMASYVEVQEMLQHAVDLYLKLVKKSGARSDDVAGLAYETFLIRSTLAQTVRTIGALAGDQGAAVCAQMMLNYLQCEAQLRQLRFVTDDGSRPLIQEYNASIQEERNGTQKRKRQWNALLLMSGPFLHDMSLVLYDLFFDLAGRVTLVSMPNKRRFASADDQLLLSDLWTAVRQFPPHTWSRPFSPEWQRTRKPIPPHLATKAADVIAACTFLYIKVLLSTTRFEAAIRVWQEAEVLFGPETKRPHVARMLEMISDSLRNTRRDLLTRKSMSSTKLHQTVAAYCLGLLRMAEAMRGSGNFETHSAAHKPMKFDSAIRCILKASELVELGIAREQQDVSHIVQANEALRRWFDACLDSDKSLERGGVWPGTLSMASCNMLLEACVSHSSLFGRPSTFRALRFLQAMASPRTRLPVPDETSITILIAHSTKLHDRTAMWGSLKAAYDMAWLRARQRSHVEPATFMIGGADGKPLVIARRSPIDALVIYALLRDAKERSDGARMLAILQAICATRTQGGVHDEVQVIGPVDARRVVFTLYPSLDLWRRSRDERLHRFELPRVADRDDVLSKALDKDGNILTARGAADATRSNEGSVIEEQPRASSAVRKVLHAVSRLSQVQYDPPVMTLVMSLVVKQGKTGLAERVWRMALRTRVRREAMRRALPYTVALAKIKVGYSIRFAELIMMAYCIEVRRGTKPSLPGHGRLSSVEALGRRPDRVAGWGRARRGSRGTTAAATAVATFKKTLSRAVMAREMVIERYLEVRKIWQSMGILDYTASTTSVNDALRLEPFFPSRTFFDLVIRAFRLRAGRRQRIDVQRQTHIAFVRMVLSDMNALEMDIPDDLQEFVVY